MSTARKTGLRGDSLPAASARAVTKRARVILARLEEHYPDAHCALNFATPFELLVATILSAQCTDERVNIVTETLFRKYPTPASYLEVEQEELERDIHSTGFFRNKAKNIRGACRLIVEEYGGSVPASMEQLLALPGVARKTANVVLGTAFGLAEGIVVDTHVGRVARRLGLTQHEDAEKVERDLVGIVPRREWIMFSHRLVTHGRRVCHARTPRCEDCLLSDVCPSSRV
jgi:endonuclease-3